MRRCSANIGATEPTTLSNIGTFINIYTAKQPAFVLLLIVLAFGLGWSVCAAFSCAALADRGGAWLFLTIVLMFGLNLAFPDLQSALCFERRSGAGAAGWVLRLPRCRIAGSARHWLA